MTIGAGLLCIGSALAAQAMGVDGCIAVQAAEFGGGASPPPGASPRRPEVTLLQAGRYCLESDLHQRKLLDPRTGREMKTLGGDAIVLVGADDVSVDLQGHRISNERELGYTLLRHYRYEPGLGHFHAFVRTRIHNGRLFSPGSRGIGIRLASSRTYDTPGFGMPVRIPQGSKPADVFRDTGHVLEDLRIEAGSHAILLDGANNIIRNNRLVVDSTTAIVAQGPGVLIENNVIEVRRRPRSSPVRQPAGLPEAEKRGEAGASSVIRLIQADGAVVRNNQIRLLGESGEDPLPAAIDLAASRDVVVEDNAMQGMRQVILADAESSYREARNCLQVCAGKAVRFLPPDEAGDAAVARQPSCRSLLDPARR